MYNNIHKDNDINIGFKNILIFIEGDLYVTLTANSIINNTKETMNIYYYKKDFWTLLSKSPKRPLSTVYLKENTQDKTLNNEIGINKFKQLYYDKYNYETGKFDLMTSNMQREYKRDLKKLYRLFNKDKDYVKDINGYEEIMLKDFHNSYGCKNCR